MFELAVEGGAEDVSQDEDSMKFAPVENFKTLIDALRAARLRSMKPNCA